METTTFRVIAPLYLIAFPVIGAYNLVLPSFTLSRFNMSPMALENDVEVGESLPPATEHVRHTLTAGCSNVH